ncbi:hypothetical protein [Streptomyces sp. NRRL S-1022]|uniref:hypothetical protein n=1 Tax=Streptomyces sp. NRRL S-1022 TaxID=1463880 RepID=UPI000B07CF93|nr:hypothetical protein [Streptomyces sp. NRRL S-1022]
MTAEDAPNDISTADITAMRRTGVLFTFLRSRITRPAPPRLAARPWDVRRTLGHRPDAWPAPAAPRRVCDCPLCQALTDHIQTDRAGTGH